MSPTTGGSTRSNNEPRISKRIRPNAQAVAARIFAVLLWILCSGVGNVAHAAAPTTGAGITPEEPGSSSRSAAMNSSGDATLQTQQTKVIDGHLLLDLKALTASANTTSAEKFESLREERNWALSEIRRRQNELSALNANPHQKPVPVPVLSEQAYNAQIEMIDSKITGLEGQQNDLSVNEGQRAAAHAQLIDLTGQKARKASELIESRQYQSALADYLSHSQKEQQIRQVLADTEDYIARADSSIDNLLVQTNKNDRFRLLMGGGFVFLVLTLIGCFFGFASRSGSIQDIFSHDRGLQFITLFSLVIAITLFGVMNILEGRELAALLGGLSGYILGRTNFGEVKAATQTVNGSTTATGNPPPGVNQG
jgi:hypothetical protein